MFACCREVKDAKHAGGFRTYEEAHADQLRRKIIKALLWRLEATKEKIILEGKMSENEKRLEHIEALEQEIKGKSLFKVKQN